MKIKRLNYNNDYFHIITETTDEEDKGIYLFTKVDKVARRNKISSLFYIKEKIRSMNYLNGTSKIWYKVVVADNDKENEFLVRAKDLFNSSTNDNTFYDLATDNGLKTNNKKLLVEFLKQQEEAAPVKEGIENLGWSNNHYYIKGFSTDTEKIFTGSDKNQFTTRGTKEAQYKFLQSVYSDYPLVSFIFSYTQAGFLNRFIDEEMNQVLELIGESSTGKSTTGKLCMSSYGDPSEFASFNMTKMSITETMKYYQDGFIFFDEIGEMKIKIEERTDLVYTLANAITKSRTTRLDKDSDFTTTKQNRLFYSLLLGGEESILKNIKKTGGLEARLCQIVLDKNTHLFEGVDSDFISKFVNDIKTNYGFLAIDFITYIQEHQNNLKEEYEINLDFVRSRFKTSSSIEDRKIRILAYSYTSAKIIMNIIYNGLELERQETILLLMLDTAQKAIFTNMNYETNDEDIFKINLSNIIQTKSNYFLITEFGSQDMFQGNLKEMWGYVDKSSTHLEIKIISTEIEKYCNSINLDKDRLLSYVSERGYLVCDQEKGKNRKTKKVKGVNYYYFKIPLTFFEYEAEQVATIQEDDQETTMQIKEAFKDIEVKPYKVDLTKYKI